MALSCTNAAAGEECDLTNQHLHFFPDLGHARHNQSGNKMQVGARIGVASELDPSFSASAQFPSEYNNGSIMSRASQEI